MRQLFYCYKTAPALLGIALALFISLNTVAQTAKHVVSGKVTDARSGSPLSSVTVKEEGSAGAATSAAADGRYSLTLNSKSSEVRITFSSVGYKSVSRSVNLSSGTATLDVALTEDVAKLDEVVVTGTTIATTKKQLGNAIATLSGRELTNGAATSIDQAMAGKISGAQISQNSGNPAGGISVHLRGNSTIAGSSDPLYIVDGVIVNNSSSQLIDLGGYTQNRLVDLNPADIDHIEVIKGAAAAAIYGSRASNGVVQIFTKKGKSGKPVITFSTQFRQNSLRKKIAINEYPYRFTNTLVTDTTRIAVKRYDLQDLVFRKGYGTENNISVSGGSDNTQYYLSGSYLGNQGIIKSTDFQRGSVKLRLDQRFNSWLKASVGLNYMLNGSHEIPNGGINSSYGALTGFIFANNFVNPYPDPVTGVYPSVAPTNVLLRTNPLEAVNRFDFIQQTNRFLGDFQLTATPINKLSITYTLGFDNSTQLATAFIPIGNTTPTYNQGYSSRVDRLDLLMNQDLNIGYKTDIGASLESTTSFGATAQTERINTASLTGTQLSPVTQVASGGASITALESRSILNILGFYVQQTFGYKDKLFVTGAIRNDASSSFGVTNRWQYYPKVSGAYIISEEKFWQNSSLASAIPTLKIRASYGQSGNLTAIGAYDRFSNYNTVSQAGLPGVTAPSQLGNAEVKPERQTEKEAGIDASFLKGRLSVEFSVYSKDVHDLLLPVTLRPSTGYLTQYQNIGNMTNKGIELLVNVIPVENADFKWTSTVIFSKNKNRVYDIPGGVLTFAGGFGQVAAVNGYSLGAFYATSFARNADGSLLLNAAGLPQTEKVNHDANGQPFGATKLKVIGDPNPDWTGSFINEFAVGKNLTLRMQWDASYGNQVFNFTKRVGDRDLYGGLKGYEKELKGEVPKGTSAALFSIMENWIENGSFLKLRELSASYSLYPHFMNGKPMRITLSGRNLLSIDNYPGWDPETNAAGQSTAVRGFDFVEVPIPRTIALSFNFNF